MCLRDLVTIDDMYTRMPEKQWLYSSFSKYRSLYIYPVTLAKVSSMKSDMSDCCCVPKCHLMSLEVS